MKIGELAKVVGCSVEAIRFYEKQGLITSPARTQGGFRLYTENHLQQLSFICYCRSLDMSLKEIKMLLNIDKLEGEQTIEVHDLLDRHIKEVVKRIHELDHLRLRLLSLKNELNRHTTNEHNLISMLLAHRNLHFVPMK
ncbi:MerR family transcriptional regulator [Actinobacillus arthritidis]|uniref:MerR family transcriptional regulator n=1 Tax=Actinobacillus arthritidis TaxID=157339 RepID=UPI0024415F11|nr:MerR family transcriptional regulator [Actinobacillus arthritidis]WGE90008.1 MerR family transcriptional regulator [Actinobacillus arthritidis]